MGDPRDAPTSGGLAGGLDQEGATSMAGTTVQLARDAQQVGALLDSPEIAALITDLDATRWDRSTGLPNAGDGRPGTRQVGVRAADVIRHARLRQRPAVRVAGRSGAGAVQRQAPDV